MATWLGSMTKPVARSIRSERSPSMSSGSDSAEVFDNSGPGPVTVATFVAGDVIGSPR